MGGEAGSRQPRAALILLAAGSGQRSGLMTNKVLLPLGGRPVFTWSLDASARSGTIAYTVLVIRPSDRDDIAAALSDAEAEFGQVTMVVGGATRHESEWAGLEALSPFIRSGAIDVVAIHDAARPLATPEMLKQVVTAARRHGGALPGRPLTGIVPLDASSSAPAGNTIGVQTPQAFRAEPLLAAYAAAQRAGFQGGDTSSCIERFGAIEIVSVPGDAGNLKITFAEDVAVAERLLRART